MREILEGKGRDVRREGTCSCFLVLSMFLFVMFCTSSHGEGEDMGGGGGGNEKKGGV